jgi:hypothetical protein
MQHSRCNLLMPNPSHYESCKDRCCNYMIRDSVIFSHLILPCGTLLISKSESAIIVAWLLDPRQGAA